MTDYACTTISRLAKSCLLAMAMCLALVPATARANDYPTRPVKIVYGYPAGGAGDVIGRMVAERLSASLGQQFIMENRSGAAGTIATSAVSRADADGYTILLVIESHAINPSLFASLPYDTAKDFTPIGMVGRSPLMLVVNKDVPAKSFKEFVAVAKEAPNGPTIAHFGPGSPQFYAMLNLSQKSGIKFSDVPYRGGAPAISDLVAGHIQSFFMTQGSAMEYTKAGALRALAAASANPLPLYPDVPTLRSLGYDLVAEHWFGFVAPAKLPPEILKRLEDALADALAQPSVQQRLTQLGVVLTPMKSAEFGEFLAQQTAYWTDFNKKNGLEGSVK